MAACLQPLMAMRWASLSGMQPQACRPPLVQVCPYSPSLVGWGMNVQAPVMLAWLQKHAAVRYGWRALPS